jgi:hypothetical protein
MKNFVERAISLISHRAKLMQRLLGEIKQITLMKYDWLLRLNNRSNY